jgi:hypothetical protein
MEQPLFDLQLDSASQAYLSETAKWGRFLAIVGFIFCAFILIIGIVFAVTLNSGVMPNDSYGVYGGMLRPLIGGIYIVMSVVYLFPCIFLNNYSSRMKAALASNDQDSLSRSFSSLKTFFKFWGILTIIGLVLMAIAIVGSIVSVYFLTRH